MIVEIAGAVFTYSFSHALIRDALYAELSHGAAHALAPRDRRVARGAWPSASDARLAELAYHFFETIPGGGDAGKAVAYARRAARARQGDAWPTRKPRAATTWPCAR